MNNTQDKQYLALELTKILFSDKEELSVSNIATCYGSMLKEITGTIESVEEITGLKKRITELQERNEKLMKENVDVLRPFGERLLDVLQETKKDMEPYVYSILTTMINEKIR